MPAPQHGIEEKGTGQQKAKVPPTWTQDPAGPVALAERAPALAAAFGNDSTGQQATLLSHKPLQHVQRMQLAGQIAQIQGNQHLHRVIASFQPATNGDGHGRAGFALHAEPEADISAAVASAAGQDLSEIASSPLVQRNGPPAEDEADRCAQAVHDALSLGVGPDVLEALEGHDPSLSRRIQQRFQARYRRSLKDALRLGPISEAVVQAFALLTSTNYHEPHTAIALCLLLPTTRDTELFRILRSLPLARRPSAEHMYDRTFGEIGAGSLKADLRGDLSDCALQKSLALLHHNLKSAEWLYFDSVAISGIHTASVVGRIQREWERGPAVFARFVRDWDDYVLNGASWSPDPAWTDMTLTEAMRSELSGESWRLVEAVLNGYEESRRGARVETEQASEDQIFQQEDIQLDVAQRTFDMAIGRWQGPNKEQVARAVTAIQQIWQRRIERADRAGDARRRADYQRQWAVRRATLLHTTAGVMDPGSAEFQRVRLLALGNLTPADEVWLAAVARDLNRLRSLVTQHWAQGKMGDLLNQANTQRMARINGSETQVRPSFDLSRMVLGSSINALRVLTLTRLDEDDPGRGARRLKLELDQGINDSDLRRGYELLTTENINSRLRTSTIETFAGRNLADFQGSPKWKFLQYVGRRYRRSTTCWDFRDLLDPATRPEEMVRRAEGRLAASRTGIADPFLRVLADVSGTLTGERPQQVAEESLARLRYIAREAGADPDELAAMMVMTGARGPAELAGMEYNQFRARLGELRNLKQSIADTLATCIEVAVETALTAATAGTAAPALLTTLSSAVAGMAAREALLGEEYDFTSQASINQLLLSVATARFESLGEGVSEAIIQAERLEDLSRVQRFWREAISEGVNQAGTVATTAAFEGKLPSAENIAAEVLTVVGASAAAGVRGAIRHRLDESLPVIERMRVEVAARAAENVVGAVSEEGAGLIREGMGNRSWGEITGSLGRKVGVGIVNDVVSGPGDVLESAVERRRGARALEERNELRRAAGLGPEEEGE